MRKVQLLGLALAGTTISVLAFAQVMNLPPGTVVSFPDGAKIDLKLPPKLPELSLLVDPEEINKGQSASLNWSATNASSCAASEGWTGNKAVQGSEVVSPQANSTYSLSCSGDGGAVSKSVDISVKEPLPPSALQISGPYTTPAAAVELPLLASGKKSFPAQWTWGDKFLTQPRAATTADNLVPKIEQWRDDKLVATWKTFSSDPTSALKMSSTAQQIASSPEYLAKASASGAGPFGLLGAIDVRYLQDNDVLLVYPAIYSGPYNNFWVSGERRDYYSDPVKHIPTNITIRGVTVNGVRPVIYRDNGGVGSDFASTTAALYFGASVNMTMENIDLERSPDAKVNKSGIYINGVNGLTLRQMRIHGFGFPNAKQYYGENGVFGANNSNKGTILFDQVDVYDNGGADGPAHNFYMGECDCEVVLQNSWSHDVQLGQLFKSRAHKSTVRGSYLQGTLAGAMSTDNWDADFPNGGEVTVENTIFTKNKSLGKSGSSNGAAITFGSEGPNAAIPQSLKVRNNTFVAYTLTYDGGHPVWPFFFQGHVAPSGNTVTLPGLTTPVPVDIKNNLYVGYPDQTYAGNAYMNYRGDMYVRAAFSEIGADFSLLTKIEPANKSDPIIGAPMYGHAAQGGVVRKLETIGAMD